MPHLRILGMYGRSLACRDADDFLKKHGKNIEELNLKTLPGGDIFRSCEKVKKLRIEEKKPVRNSLPLGDLHAYFIMEAAWIFHPGLGVPNSGERLFRL